MVNFLKKKWNNILMNKSFFLIKKLLKNQLLFFTIYIIIINI